tara:strand:+ start:196 stop:1281 length:1086 start_codon:yes stop_codon:yes gene_type:complete
MALSTIGTNQIASESVTVPKVADQVLSSRNLIINGSVTVNQRGTQTGIRNSFGVDRFKSAGDGAQIFTYSQSTTVPSGQGFSYSAKLDVTTADTSVAAGEYHLLVYNFEGQDLQHLKYGTSGAESVTLQFWVRSPKTGTHIVELNHQDAAYFNSQAYTIASANTWQKVTLTFSGYQTTAITNDNTHGFGVAWWLMAGSTYSGGTLASNTWQNTAANRAAGQVNVVDSTSNEFYITGVQLEVGDTATPFEHENYGTTLRKCQRYYYPAEKYNIYAGWAMTWGAATQYPKVNADFPVQMRAAPAISYAQSNNGTVNQIEWVDGSTTGASSWGVGVHGIYYVYTPSNIAANVSGQFRYTADAEL